MNLKNIIVRKMDIYDSDKVCKIFAQGDTYHKENLPHIFNNPPKPARNNEFFNQILNSEKATILVAELQDSILGFVFVSIRKVAGDPLLKERSYAVVDNMVVEEKYRNKGLGRILLTEAITWAKIKGITKMELNVWEFNQNAINFYEKLGFETISRKMKKKI
ncbi:MAG: GNAT family N-acetyltransferase [bacterium]